MLERAEQGQVASGPVEVYRRYANIQPSEVESFTDEPKQGVKPFGLGGFSHGHVVADEPERVEGGQAGSVGHEDGKDFLTYEPNKSESFQLQGMTIHKIQAQMFAFRRDADRQLLEVAQDANWHAGNALSVQGEAPQGIERHV